MEQFARTELLIGQEGMEKLKRARVAVFGIGGVGGYVVEALARSGVGGLDLIDDDRICLSNLNRQIIATHRTLGQYKVDAARERILEINPEAEVHVHKVFYMPETAEQFDFSQYDYVVDAIDTVTGKLMLVQEADRAGTPVISAMGAGNKLDPAAFEVADIYETSVCPLARVMRRELKKRGIRRLKVVYSREKPLTPRTAQDPAMDAAGQRLEDTAGNRVEDADGNRVEDADGNRVEDAEGNPAERPRESGRRQTPGSMAFVPSAAGLIVAGEVIRDLIFFL